MGFSLTDDLLGSHDQPDLLVLQDDDRFHFILRSNEIALLDSTLIMVIFAVRRAATGLFDMVILHKFFVADGQVKRTVMSKKDISPETVEEVVSKTASTFAQRLRSHGHEVTWEELDLRKVRSKNEQVKMMDAWGVLKVKGQ